MSTERHASRFAPPAAAADGRIELIGLDRGGLQAALAEIGAEPFRARQLWHWIYHRGVRDFDAMTNLAKGFRARLAERFTVGRPEAAADTLSEAGTRKWLLRFSDSKEFETVHIP
jgi:23S rRNA (adenine2503-C2)-methyltransferase